MAELRVTNTGTIKLFESDDTSSVTIASPASLGGDRTITLPDANVDLTEVNTMPIANLDIDGGTDIGAAITDSDLFIIDDGAGGTNRKTAASRIKTYAGFSVSDITGATELAETPADTDEFIISDAGTLKRVDFSHIKGGGITEIDTWVYTSNESVSGGNATLTSAWNRESQGGFSKLGTGMSEASGVFSFPSTGFYKIDFGIYYECGGARDRMGGQILVTTNNSSYDERTELANSCSSNGHKVSSLTSAIVDVTDTSNVKVKFNYQASGDATLNGSSSLSKTFVIFTRLADT